jgi:adhesin/invasin
MGGLRFGAAFVAAVVAGSYLVGCGGGGGGGGGGSYGPNRLSVVSGDGQSGAPGTALASPLVIQLQDAAGNAVAGGRVDFLVASGGGSLTGGAATTDATGRAQATLQLGPAGVTLVTASASGVTPVTFTATATTPGGVASGAGAPGKPTTLEHTRGGGQSGVVGTSLPTPLEVTIRDANRIVCPGISVTFNVTQGGGSISTIHTETDAAGRAWTTLTLGPTPGQNVVQVISPGLTGSGLTFSATAAAGPSASVVVTSGQAQTGTAGQLLPAAVVVTVFDVFGNPAAGRAVQLGVLSGGGSVAALASFTDANGALRAQWTLGAPAGVQLLGAITPGLGTTVITATARAGAAATLARLTGDGQTGVAGQPLALPLVVHVDDGLGNAVGNTVVNYTILTTGGSLSVAAPRTNAAGDAQVTLTLPTAAGAVLVEASAPGLTGSPVLFAATATAATTATRLSLVSGNNQSGTVGLAVTDPMVVVALDANGNPVAGVPVTFVAAAGGGSVAGAPMVTRTTDATGQPQPPVTLTLGAAAGANTVTVNASGLTGSPLVITATGRAAAAARIRPLTGNGQSQAAGAALAQPVVAVVEDALGNPVAGVPVGFTVTGGGGSASPPTTLTDSLGRAQAVWTMGATAGPASLQAVASGVVTPTTFSATATSATATVVASSTGSGQLGLVGTALPLPLEVAVRDAFGNPVANFDVTFAVVTGGGRLSATRVATDAGGVAAATWVLGATAGPQTVSATAPGLGGSQIGFAATALAGPAARLALRSGNGQYAAVGTSLPAPLEVVVQDASGNPVANQFVLFQVGSGGGTIFQSLPFSDVAGVVSATLVFGPGAGTTTVQAISPGLAGSPLVFTEFAVAAAADTIVTISGGGQRATVGAALAQPVIVRVADASGNPVAGVPVSFAVTAGGGSISPPALITDAVGRAQAVWTVGTTPGPQTVSVSAPVASGVPAVFQATAVAGPPVSITPFGPYASTAAVGSTVGPLFVRVSDAWGNPVPGADVLFSTTQGGGAVLTPIVATDTAGIASGLVVVGPTVGPNLFLARLAVTPGSPVLFQVDAVAGGATDLALLGGDGQTGSITTTLTDDLVVVVRDSAGNPVAGHPVSFAVTLGGGPGGATLSATSATTDALGRAATRLTFGIVAGLVRVEASAPGLTGSPVAFQATATANAPVYMEITAGHGTTNPVGTSIPLVVTVKDGLGLPVPNVLVTFTHSSGPGSVAPPGMATNGAGQASTTLTFTGTPGTVAVVASASGPNGPLLASPLTLTASSVPAAPATLEPVTSTFAQVSAGGSVTHGVRVRDAFGNLVPGVLVTFTPSGGSVSSPVVPSSTPFALAYSSHTPPTTVGASTVTATCGAASLVFDVQTVASSPNSISIVSGDHQSVPVGGTFAPCVVEVRDLYGNRCPSASVRFTPGAGVTSPALGTLFTDGVGRVTVVPVLDADPRRTTLEARIYPPAGPFVAFDLVRHGSAARVVRGDGSGQVSDFGATLARQLSVRVVDANGLPVPGHGVAFEVVQGGGALVGQTTRTVTTDNLGWARSSYTLGPSGSQRVEARTAGLLGSPARFQASLRPELSTGVVTGDRGCVEVPYTLQQLDGELVDVRVEVDVGNTGTFRPATQVGLPVASSTTKGTTALRPNGGLLHFAWDSTADAPLARGLAATLRLTPSLRGVAGSSQTVGILSLWNGADYYAVGSVALGATATDLTLADLDRDGRPDLVAALATTELELHPGDGSSVAFTATPTVVATSQGGLSAVVAGDLDRDAWIDLVVADPVYDQVKVLYSDHGVFGAGVSVAVVGSAPVALALADVNRDGKLDIVTANGGGSVSVVERGPAGLDAHPPIALPGGPVALVVEDLDRDGDLDLAVALEAADAVAVLRGDGAGGFAPPETFAVGDAPVALAAGDLDRDGRLDLLVALRGADALRVLRNTGPTFAGQPLVALGGGRSPQDLALLDVDHDGWLDAVATHDAGAARVLLGSASGLRTTGAGAFDASTGADPTALLTTDLDVDGLPDLVVADASGAAVLLNEAPGRADPRLETYTSVRGSLDSRLGFAIAAGDLNGDGRVDVVVPRYDANRLAVFLGQGNGHFVHDGDVVADRPYAVALADMDRDGDLDLVSAPAASDVVVALNDYDLGPGHEPATWTCEHHAIPYTGGHAVIVTDVDGDDAPDVCVIQGEPAVDYGFVELLRHTGSGSSLHPPVTIGIPGGALAAAAGDVDQDGFVDLVVGETYSTMRPCLLRGDGQGGFTPNLLPQAPGSVHGLALADLTGDGLLDLAAVGYNAATSRNLAIYRNLGGGTFNLVATHDAMDAAHDPANVVALDLDRDGDLDLFLSGEAVPSGVQGSPIEPVVLRNQGGGVFGSPTSLPSLLNGLSPVVADLTGDGQPDVALTETAHCALLGLEGNGQGGFRGPLFLPEDRSTTYAIELHDLDGDGRLDLLTTGDDTPGVGSLRVRLGNGDGTFRSFTSYPHHAVPTGVTVGDWNRDGVPDVASNAYLANGYVRVWKGSPSAPGTLAHDRDLSASGHPFSVLTADVDRDGNPDLVGAAASVVFYGDGTGAFPDIRSSAIQNALDNSVVDLNQDGFMDLFAPQIHPENIRASFGDGTRNFVVRAGPVVPYVEEYVGPAVPPNHSSAHELVDVDADGRLDMVFPSYTTGRLVILWGTPAGPPELDVTSPTELTPTPAYDLPLGVVTTDLDGDGRLEIVVPENGVSAFDVRVVDQDEVSPRLFDVAGQRRWFTGTRSNGLPGLLVADVNRDGRMDVIVVGSYGAPTNAGVQVLLGR